ncbi:carboxymuconolactone decarboxylase family protein [Flavivirga abyssicola]|uniref:carboxymuconolactone decarboxylase family protein n=1 Tax=Flavivirga abyssicola TaxID=3063533 RepID=UPI0026DF1DD7|nr:carboxymuconolactone decarboxylase family protein [Flavivirga sp. MEBiC07777]WVK11693.1 carboxymuconolactone decarboxylase family protein [Flavivirga sp. MEBiC07777]
MAHLEPLSKSLHSELEPKFDHYQKTRGFIPNSILTMQRRPEISKAFMQLNQVILYEGTVSEELKMLISLISSQASGCRYCQAHMANLSRIYKASKEKIESVWEFQTSPLFSEAERAALNVAFKGALIPNMAATEDFDELKKHFSESEIVEIVASLALFGYLNRWNDTMATDLEDYPKEVAQELIGSKGWNPGKHG